ncbi:MAG: Rpn family recombination-promoting nuclease/putative transposase [Lachnospiraceae bacterium]|nr:Rpn family recombination-promoting nuclease/putative transposase [Lachnospiraceae bacterium]
MAEKKFYGMKNDYMFKAVLQSAEDVLKNLVSVLMEIDENDIVSCTIVNTIELGRSVDSKDCVLDVKLLLNENEIIDLEIQVRNEHNWPERSLLYWSRTYDYLKSGQEYSELKKTYHIGILDFTLFKDNPAFYAEYKLLDTKTGYLYTDKLNIRVLDLTKVDEADGNVNPKLIKWARIFRAETMSELEQLAGEEEVLMSMVTHLKELSEDEKIRQQCAARDDYERRLIGEYKRGTREGRESGRLEDIRTIMDTLGLTKEQAMDALKISENERLLIAKQL